ncbi:dihydrofolate reductase family protein [Chitinophaga pinensis]|uniref:Bifunctional deaminase-reductase domain protein n=1 Tax=Chitinophaga pinensis (strain ATCC 43595 / DSM 2588 / LMG 13176 / NBRC 15968 / NCIMB 11800 / UQM 2034) TaxID=485918 RepID=A0A979G895_CHIPD|nr:dihydrofolate reductase family protein [Chitinophaga pinensis]ACU62606.1 bifunctional deaminase-reductase domain protein [Chitinophaga pinensis DSM 2588]
MRKVIVTMFMTMDGVLQAPGGADEDTSNGFEWGGWSFPYGDDLTDQQLAKIMSEPYDLLLGRRTYEIFAAYWPYHADNPIGEMFNRIQKYVVATTPVDLSWKHSTLISENVVDALKQLKSAEGPALLVHGSSRLVQTLLAERLIDELHMWIHPITLGKGKQLFQEGTRPQQWKLVETVVGDKGMIIASYVPDGEVQTASIPDGELNEAEIARREKHAKA